MGVNSAEKGTRGDPENLTSYSHPFKATSQAGQSGLTTDTGHRRPQRTSVRLSGTGVKMAFSFYTGRRKSQTTSVRLSGTSVKMAKLAFSFHLSWGNAS